MENCTCDHWSSQDPPEGPRGEARQGGPPREGSGGSLGTTYEITSGFPSGEEQGKAILRRLERYRLQFVARALLAGHRIQVCLRFMTAERDLVEVWKSREHRRAHYKGLMICGSVWVCPVCAAKVSEGRRTEMLEAVQTWRDRGGRVLLLTQTVPHHAGQGLKEVLEGFQRARSYERRHWRWRKVKEALGIAGSVRALEVTWGGNGWHVHVHELLFVQGDAPHLAVMEFDCLASWQGACEAVGVDTPNGHGVRLHDGTYAAEYASKWGIADEVTKAHVKRGRGEHLGPWDLLRRVYETVSLGKGDSIAARAFKEYADTFKGRRQLVWSRGLRALLGLVKESSDEELAEGGDDDALLLGSLSRRQWVAVRDAEKRGELLEVATEEGWAGVLRLVGSLMAERRQVYEGSSKHAS